jgi:hypothetical protein
VLCPRMRKSVVRTRCTGLAGTTGSLALAQLFRNLGKLMAQNGGLLALTANIDR